MKLIKLAKNFTLAATEYASQANADLGIRDSGKTYTAMKAAEQLLLAGIPIIVYDPVGVWKNIRSGLNGKKGFPVIVAGGDSDSDIILTPENAVQIVRAMMKAGVSLIIDLYSPSLSNKSKWIKIVQETIDVLMYENRDHGLRHIFIEEASEFIPQRVMPQQGKVYSSIERIARMGRNASLGMTIINQRAEEVNKAVLELCALVFLHKQTGKNSLNSIKKWLELMGVENRGEVVIQDLPKLKQGECIVVDTNSDSWFEKIKILPKQTFHPSPEKGVPLKAAKSNANISSFIKKLNHELNKRTTEAKKTTENKKGFVHVMSKPEEVNELKHLNKILLDIKLINSEYKKQLEFACSEIRTLSGLVAEYGKSNSAIHEELSKIKKIKPFVSKVKMPETKSTIQYERKIPAAIKHGLPAPSNNQYKGKAKMIKGVSQAGKSGISKGELAIMCGMSPTSGTYGVYYRELRRDGLIAELDRKLYISGAGHEKAKLMSALSTDINVIIEMWYKILGENNGMTRILTCIFNNRSTNNNVVPVSLIEDETGMVASSGTFGVYIRKLRRMGLIEYDRGEFKLSRNFDRFLRQ